MFWYARLSAFEKNYSGLATACHSLSNLNRLQSCLSDRRSHPKKKKCPTFLFHSSTILRLASSDRNTKGTVYVHEPKHVNTRPWDG